MSESRLFLLYLAKESIKNACKNVFAGHSMVQYFCGENPFIEAYQRRKYEKEA